MKRSAFMEKLIDDLAKEMYGVTRTEALGRGVCVRCASRMNLDGEDPSILPLSERERAEYENSALCPSCFRAITLPEEEQE